MNSGGEAASDGRRLIKLTLARKVRENVASTDYEMRDVGMLRAAGRGKS